MKVDMRQFLQSFFDEASEHIENMEGALLQLESRPNDSEILNTIFRAAHTIKGASSTFGVHAVGEFTHILETILEKVRDGQIAVTADLTEVLLSSVDVLSGLLAAARDGAPAPENTAQVIEQLQALDVVGGETTATTEKAHDNPAEGGVYQITFKPSREFFHFGLDPVLMLRDLAENGKITNVVLDASAVPDVNEMDPETCYLSWTLQLETDASLDCINDVFMFVDSDTVVEIVSLTAETQDGSDNAEDTSPTATQEAAASAAAVTQNSSTVAPGSAASNSSEALPAAAPPPRESVRVDGERLDDMINQIGELVIGISMVEQEWSSFHPGQESSAIVQLSKIVRELQERSLSLRMIPIAACFQKMTRVVRDLSRKLGKEINFVTTGEETELDKTVVDRIGDPLLHMVRNAVDHGIETPEDRIAAGKPSEGTVQLRAFHQGGNIYIEIQDDGRGLNRKAIREKAIERGIISAEDSLSDKDLCNLIFAPGFSTAAEVTDVSGRGVGMDVVRRDVESLQGHVTVKSVEGEGSTITVRLPLTLAILDGLTVSLGDEVFVVPLLSVVESMRPTRAEVKSVLGDNEVVMMRGEVVPLLRLHKLLNVSPHVTDPCEALVVIVEEQGRKYALLVDELLGQQQVVIKNLETNFRKVPGVAGATIMGDGRIAFILDINGLSLLARDGVLEAAAVSEEPA